MRNLPQRRGGTENEEHWKDGTGKEHDFSRAFKVVEDTAPQRLKSALMVRD